MSAPVIARGVGAITAAFDACRERGTPALVAYLTAGYPDLSQSRACIDAAIAAGVDILEIGVPFSDPIADGRVIQAASDASLKGGMTLAKTLDLVRDLRRSHATPLLLMTYLNPVLSMGMERFIEEAKAAGVDGVIVPDLTPDEGEEFRAMAAARQFALVFLAAPNASDARLTQVAAATTGFLYALGLEGVTGERDQLAGGLSAFMTRVRRAAPGVPVAVGFGVSRAEHFAAIGQIADGVIVGSAVVRRMAEGPASVGAFLSELRSA